jgi:hypothetical protein
LAIFVLSTDALTKKDKPLCDNGAQIGEGGSWQFWGGKAHSPEMDYYQPGCKNEQATMFYEPKSCSLPRFASDVSARPKRVLFVGDSTVDGQAQGFAWFFDKLRPQDYNKCNHPIWKMREIASKDLAAAGFSDEEVKATDAFIGKQNAGRNKFNIHDWWGCNSSVGFALADKPPPKTAAKAFMHTVRNFWAEPLGPEDVVVMNFGVWMDKKQAVFKQKEIDQSDEDNKESMKIMMEQIKSWGKDAPKFIWREITPSHWNSWDGYYTQQAFRSTLLQCKPVTNKNLELLAKKPSGLRGRVNAMFMQAITDAGMAVDGVNVEYLPVFQAAVQRVDDHPTQWDNPTKPDCTHFCQRGSVNRFMNSAILSVASGMMQRSKATKTV